MQNVQPIAETRRAAWTFEDERAVLRLGDAVLGEVKYHEGDSMFYDALVGGVVVATSNEVFPLLATVEAKALAVR